MSDHETPPRVEFVELDTDGYLADRLLSLRLVAEYLAVDKSTVLRWAQAPGTNFPEPIWLTPTARRWRLKDINNWIDQKAQQ